MSDFGGNEKSQLETRSLRNSLISLYEEQKKKEVTQPWYKRFVRGHLEPSLHIVVQVFGILSTKEMKI